MAAPTLGFVHDGPIVGKGVLTGGSFFAMIVWQVAPALAGCRSMGTPKLGEDSTEAADSADESGTGGDHDTGTDEDGDGYGPEEGDCDDSNPAVHPGAAETACDGTDYDCDGQPSGVDDDGDGSPACDDCDDEDASAAPGLAEVCGDHADNDCDGTSNDCRLTGEHELADADAILSGEAFGEGTGGAIAGAGDIDGDGVGDFVVGADHASAEWEGAVYVVLGGASFPADLDDAWAVLEGTTSYARVGTNVQAGEDLTGDGVGDVLVHVSRAGVYLVTTLGAGRSSFETSSIAIGDGDAYFTALNSSGPAAGDVTGDGAVDLVFSAVESGQGNVDIVAGPIASSSVGAGDWSARIANDLTGTACGALDASGDLDGDGVADVACGLGDWDPVDYEEGGGFVFYGPLTGTYSAGADADAIFVGQARADVAGRYLALVGDLDADGHDDLAVGAPHFDVTGAVYILPGPLLGSIDLGTAAATLTGESNLGGCVARAGDVDGDGRDDLLVTDFRASSSAGVAWLEYGPVTGHQTLAEADSTWAGTGYSRAGSGCAGPGDVTGDGTPDLLITSIAAEGQPTTTGQVFVVAGAGL